MQNYRRFYKTLAIAAKQMHTDRDEYKRSLVSGYTNGRTEHLHEMTEREYETMCEALEALTGNTYQRDRRKARSEVLRLMQQMGIDTTDWSRVDLFCKDRRIAGKAFKLLTLEELMALKPKLRKIERMKKEKKEKERYSMMEQERYSVERERLSVEQECYCDDFENLNINVN